MRNIISKSEGIDNVMQIVIHNNFISMTIDEKKMIELEVKINITDMFKLLKFCVCLN